jgi:AraC-like DNA-binding protein
VKAKPAPSLARYIDYYWVSRWARASRNAPAVTALLDPCVHLQIHRGRSDIIGVTRRAYRMRLEGHDFVVGARFRPGGFFPFIGQPVARLTDRVQRADVTFGMPHGAFDPWTASLCRDIESCPGGADQHAATIGTHLDSVLESHLLQADSLAEEMAALVETMRLRRDLRRVRDLARFSGHSERTLHRLFLRYVGVSPARVIRHHRLRSVTERLARGEDKSIRGLAYEYGYADQAHFIREFRAMFGVTPGAYVSGSGRILQSGSRVHR